MGSEFTKASSFLVNYVENGYLGHFGQHGQQFLFFKMRTNVYLGIFQRKEIPVMKNHRKFLVLMSLVFLPLQIAIAGEIIWSIPSSPKLIFEKALAKSKNVMVSEYGVQRQALIRCIKYVGEPIAYSCHHFADNGSNPIFTKGTAVDLYENGMKGVQDNWITDLHVERSALITCVRDGDEGVYQYSCRVNAYSAHE